jgi:hypothetical protein
MYKIVGKVFHEIFGLRQQKNMKRASALWPKSLDYTGAG